jgi:uncharacterized membrane protein YozB (DUF420 family)
MRTLLAVTVASLGSVAIYAGFLLNVAALGSTLGDVLTIPGVALVGGSPLIARGQVLQRSAKTALIVTRYLSLPLFLLGAWMLALAIPSMASPGAGQVHGVYWAAVLTAAGLAAITWPELVWLTRRCINGAAP